MGISTLGRGSVTSQPEVVELSGFLLMKVRRGTRKMETFIHAKLQFWSYSIFSVLLYITVALCIRGNVVVDVICDRCCCCLGHI